MDSKSIYSVLLGEPIDNTDPVIHHSSKGYFALRIGEWKYIEGLGSGGFTQPAIIAPEDSGPTGQLFNMKQDPSEENDLFSENQEKVSELKSMLDEIRNQ